MPLLQALFPFHAGRAVRARRRPVILEPADLDRLRSAIAEASSEARSAFFYFALFGLYFIVAVAGTTHEDLLRGSTITMPGLGIGLPIVGFYAFVPLLFILLHLYVLLQIFIVARTPKTTVAALRDLDQAALRRRLASPFLVTQWLFGYPPKLIYTIVVWSSLVILPVLFLVTAQLRFLPYHLESVTWLHRGYVLTDVVIVLSFWLLILIHRHGWLAGPTSLGATLRAVSGSLSYLLLTGLGGLAIAFAFLVATVPGETTERCLLRESGPDPGLWCSAFGGLGSHFAVRSAADGRRMLAITYDLLEAPGARLGLRRNLVARYARLVVASPVPGTADEQDDATTAAEPTVDPAAAADEPVRNEADELAHREKEAWRLSGEGINLRGRDLRYADLTGSDLRGADLRGADLQRAVLKETLLAFADLGDIERRQVETCRPGLSAEADGAAAPCATRLNDADLRGADLRFSRLWKTDLRAANLAGARLDYARLDNSWLIGALLNFASLRNSVLTGADARAAVLREVRGGGADLAGAKLEGAFLGARGPTEIGPEAAGLGGVDEFEDQWSRARELHRLACGDRGSDAGRELGPALAGGVARRLWEEYDQGQSHGGYEGMAVSRYLLAGAILSAKLCPSPAAGPSGAGEPATDDFLKLDEICHLHQLREALGPGLDSEAGGLAKAYPRAPEGWLEPRALRPCPSGETVGES